jgi:Flp pilus assembly protein TadG
MKFSIFKRMRSDKGSSELISLIILLPIVLAILFTMIDASIYFSNRAQVQAAARDGARTAAIMGGDGTATTATPIELKYGVPRSTACVGLSTSPMTKTAYKPATTSAIECQVLQAFTRNSSLISVEITSVICTPSVTAAVGSKTTCTVDWDYNSIPGSSLGFIKIGQSNTVVGTAEAEVGGTGLGPR